MKDTNLVDTALDIDPELAPEKFLDPHRTAKGEPRAVVALTRLRTLWFNTGSLCNITCQNCYMDSSPKNDRLAYITAAEVGQYLDESETEKLGIEEVAFTGGEPFMNPEFPQILKDVLSRGYQVLVLSNAMKPMHHKKNQLLSLRQAHPGQLSIRISVDHYTCEGHEAIRGKNTWKPMLEGLKWLADNGFDMSVAGRTCWDETEQQSRDGFRQLFEGEVIPIDVTDPARLVLFPEMDSRLDVPEITVNCWDILGITPETMMCATSRMVVKRRGAEAPVVVPCTLLPYEETFELGQSLSESAKTVSLNHPHCARFCVLGGASCSPD